MSVWNCLFGVLTDTLDSKSSIFRFSCPRCLLGAVCLFVCMPVCWFGSLRVHFPAQVRGILNRHLRQDVAKPLRRCLLDSIFLHGLEEYWSYTFDKAVLSLLERVRGSQFSCTGTWNIGQKPSTRLPLSVYQLKGCSEPEKLKTSWASKSVQNNYKTIRNWQLFGFRAPWRPFTLPNASRGRAVCLEAALSHFENVG